MQLMHKQYNISTLTLNVFKVSTFNASDAYSEISGGLTLYFYAPQTPTDLPGKIRLQVGL